MSRFFVLVVVTVFALVAFASTAEATHEWGHRYMIAGRVIDSEGEPAQGVPVYISMETTLQTDPWMIVNTRCDGTYYSLEQTGDPQRGGGLELGRMHIHNADLPSDARYTVRVLKDANEDYAEKRGQARVDMKYSTVNLELDEPIEKQDQCPDGIDLSQEFLVVGHAQRDKGNTREDLMTVPEQGLQNEVEVTIETADGERNLTVETNQFGDYFAIFSNVTVERGAKVTARWQDETRESTVSESDDMFRVSEVNIIVRDSIGGTAVKVLLWAVGAIVVVGGAVFGVSKVRENMETKRLRQTSGRKRANR